MRRYLALAIVVCFAAAPAFSQNSLSGKWATDRPAGPSEPFERRQSAQLELSIVGATASGTLTLGGLGGTFHVLKDGEVTGNRVQFRVQTGPNAQVTLTIDLVDANTVTVFQGTVVSVPVPAPATNPNVPETPAVAPVSPITIERNAQSGTASGNVRGPDGGPATRIRVAVVTLPETPGDRTSTALSTQTETDEQGRYVLQGIPQGRYMIAAGRVDNPTYYPGTREMSRATIISVSPGMVYTDLNFSTTDSGDRPVDSRPSISPYSPGPGPCVPNTTRCTVLHRVK